MPDGACRSSRRRYSSPRAASLTTTYRSVLPVDVTTFIEMGNPPTGSTLPAGVILRPSGRITLPSGRRPAGCSASGVGSPDTQVDSNETDDPVEHPARIEKTTRTRRIAG